MIIGGFQKLSLLDYPEKLCAIVFTQGCVFRCSYCHNPELIEVRAGGGMPEERVLEELSVRRKLIDGVCITGGEPTIQADLPQFIQKVRNLGLLVKLDTCGVNPWMVETLLREGMVDYIAMDIKNTWEHYQSVVQVSNRKLVENCQETFSLIQSSSTDHEFRTTVFPQVHRKCDFFKIAGYLKEGEKYYIQNIRYEKTYDPHIQRDSVIDVAGLAAELQKAYPHLYIEARG